LVLLASIGTVLTEFAWLIDSFVPRQAEMARIVFLIFEAQFLAICIARSRTAQREAWTTVATAIPGFAALLLGVALFLGQANPFRIGPKYLFNADFVFPVLFFANAGLIALGATARGKEKKANELVVILAS